MLRERVSKVAGRSVVLMDSMSQVEDIDEGQIVIAGSNGGQESGRLAVISRCGAVILNDAGVGKDDAGIIGLTLADEVGIPAMAVSHKSAEISDARSMWRAGVLSTVNEAAARAGIRVGMTVGEAVEQLGRVWGDS